MKQSKQADEVMELMKITEQLQEDGVIYATNAPTSPFQSGPGGAAKKYSKEQVLQLLDYCKAYLTKDAAMKGNDNWLTKLGLGMEEFLKLRSGSPNLEYAEGEMQGDQHAEDEPGSISFGKKTAKGKYNQDMASGGPGSVTYRSKEDSALSNIGDTVPKHSFGKAARSGKKVVYTTDHSSKS